MSFLNDSPQVLWARSVSAFQDCDCACVPEVAIPVRLSMEDGPWISTPPVAVFPLDWQWDAYLSPAGPVALVVLNKAAQKLLGAFAAPRTVSEARLRFPTLTAIQVREATRKLALTGLLQPAQAKRERENPDTLTAWLHLTNSCNLRCPYCYVNKSPRQMDEAVALRAIERLVQMAGDHGYRRLRLKYGGGEPTLNFPVLKAAHRYASSLAPEAGLALEAVLLSNGVALNDAMLDFLVRKGISLSISLDGGAGAHNRLRTSEKAGSTYEKVVSNVEKAIGRGLRPHISITVTAFNLDGVEDAVRFALERGLPFNVNFYRGWEAQTLYLAPEADALIEAVKRLLGLLEENIERIHYPLTGILDRTHFDTPHTRVCGAGRHYLAVDPEGRIAPCHILLDRPSSGLGALDPLTELRNLWGREFNRSVEELTGCQTCPWRFICAGGCPLLRRTELRERYCRVYQAILPRLIELEARRILYCYARGAHPAIGA